MKKLILIFLLAGLFSCEKIPNGTAPNIAIDSTKVKSTKGVTPNYWDVHCTKPGCHYGACEMTPRGCCPRCGSTAPVYTETPVTSCP
jgi:hypothetical protein